jgi:hypothetical protein
LCCWEEGFWDPRDEDVVYVNMERGEEEGEREEVGGGSGSGGKEAGERGEGVLFRVTTDDDDGPPGRSTSANQPGILSFARGVG